MLGTTPEYLTGETDSVSPVAVSDLQLPYRAGPPETVELQEFDVSYGLGASYIHDTAVTGRKRVFSRAWIRQFTDLALL
ncbi:hypothetical protein ACFSTD_09705 [Novosphingobium colocasiae]